MIYISLTTIPKRIKNLSKSIESLLKQSLKPNKILINIPYKYSRFDEVIEDDQIPIFKENIVEINRCEDFGPGTKLMGALDKIKKNSLLILVDDDNFYEDYMIEKFYQYYSREAKNAYSFYVHPLKNFGVGQGADGFAINSNFLEGIKEFYKKVVKGDKNLFIHDDLWISFFLFYIKKVKILSLQSQLKKNKEGKFSLIYRTHNKDLGLLSNYGTSINDAIYNRDKIALKSLDYMMEKSKSFNF